MLWEAHIMVKSWQSGSGRRSAYPNGFLQRKRKSTKSTDMLLKYVGDKRERGRPKVIESR